MSDTGWKSPGTVVDDATVGTIAWSNPDNAKTSDNSYAIFHHSKGSPISHYLKATNFGFSIPDGATINGIIVSIERYRENYASSFYDSEIKIVKADGSVGSTNKSTGAEWSTTESYVSYGSSSDLWQETWSSSSINDVDFGMVIAVASQSSPDSANAYVDHIQIKVYYTESSGTNASSERGLYTKGKNTGSSERGLYTSGYLTNSSERNIYLEGDISPLYSKESSASLKTNDTNLANTLTQQEYTDVTTDNDTYVDLVGTHEYFQFLFKEPNNNSTDDFRITWKGKSTVAPSSHTVYLQIYNRTTSTWTNLTSNNSASANTKFTLTYDVTTGMSDYYDANHVISARVYQDVMV